MKKAVAVMAVVLVGFAGLSYLGVDFVGNVKAEQKATKCNSCSGTGKCASCQGRGTTPMLDSKGNRSKCNSCEGTGRCTNCGGSGAIWK